MRRVLLLTLAVLALTAAPAAASRDQEAMFQDDNHLIYAPPATVDATLDTIKALGAQRLRITVLWKAIAPDPGSRTRPDGFDASNPDAYPSGAWDHYDYVVQAARARGMDVNFNITGPSPLWANKVPPREDVAETFEPSPLEFARFVVAVGRRYSGDWPPSAYIPPEQKVPRVSYWSIWNEPNHSGWLTPTWALAGKTWFQRSASLYRELLDAAYAALAATGHGKDTILIGELAPKGDRSKNVKRYMPALGFLRALYCLDSKLHRLKGAAATRLDCARTAKQFRAAHPGLFLATGFAHHPYELLLKPTTIPPLRDYATLSTLRRLTRVLDKAFKAYGSKRHLPLYLTEYGYETNPPDPFKPSFDKQAAYLNQAEYMAWRINRVKALSQFLLYDDGPPIGLTFQSGLLSVDGKRKPSFAAWRLPLWVTGHGSRARVWALLRRAAPKSRAEAQIQFRRAKAKKWRTLTTATSSGLRNVIYKRVRIPGKGRLRVKWGAIASRTAHVR